MDINKLAILANRLGGVDVVSDALDVDIDLIQKTINGEYLTNYEQALIDTAYARLELEPQIAIEYDIDTSEIDNLANELELANNFIADVQLENQFRGLVADQIIGNQDVDLSEATSLFANLETNRVRTILNKATELDAKQVAKFIKKMFDSYNADDQNIWEVEKSRFWAWFRDQFY